MLFVIKIKRATSQELATPGIDETNGGSRQQKLYRGRQKKSKQEKRPQRSTRYTKKKKTTGSKKLRKITRTTAHGIFGHINNDSVSESCAYLATK